MPLIKCPDCGNEVSSFAAACPRCGYPIAANTPSGDVKIRINMPGYMLNVIIYEAATGRELWRGRTGNVAIIHVDKPTEIEIKGRVKRTTATVKAGEKYEFADEIGGFFGAPREVLRLVDVIDSGF